MIEFPEHGYIEEDAKRIYYWKASTLWRLAADMPVEEVALDSFDWTNDNFQYAPQQQPLLWREIADQAKRIYAADLSYPIVINAAGNIMDGMHRVLKAYVLGHATIKAVRFTHDPPPDRVVDHG